MGGLARGAEAGGSREGRGRALARPRTPRFFVGGERARARPIGGGGGRKERDEASFLSLGGGFRTRTPSNGMGGRKVGGWVARIEGTRRLLSGLRLVWRMSGLFFLKEWLG